jgi:hypothetical protein
MRRTLAISACVAVLASAGISGLVADGGQVPKDTAATAEVYTRERANGDASLLLTLAMNAGKVSQVSAELPSDKKVAAGYLPPGWSHQQRGKRVVASGPAVDTANLRFDMPPGGGKDFTGKKTTLTGGMSGGPPVSVAMTIGELEKITVTPNLEGILTLPAQAVPGLPILIGAPDAYRTGDWQFVADSGRIPIVQVDRLRDQDLSTLPDTFRALRMRDDVLRILEKPSPRPLITIFPADGQVTRVTYIDRWGELLVDAPVPITAVQAPACSLGISGGSPFAFAGQAACVTGCFPDLAAAYGAMLDGSTELTPWAVSPTTAMHGIPSNVTPGMHTVSVPTGAGTATVGVLGVEGSIDQNSLWKGQSTTMRLRIVGTERPLRLAVLNRTPSIITIEGGPWQAVSSAGGADNVVTRSVRGIRRGDFSILYSLSLGACGAPQPPGGGR